MLFGDNNDYQCFTISSFMWNCRTNFNHQIIRSKLMDIIICAPEEVLIIPNNQLIDCPWKDGR